MTDRRRKPTATPAAIVPILTGADLPDDLVERLCGVLCPPLRATVDLPAFVRLIGASHSLNALEKLRVFAALSTLSQFQVDALIEVMEDEMNQFAELAQREWRDVAQVSASTWLHLCLVADHLGVGYADDEAEREALTAWLLRKFAGEEGESWVRRALGHHLLTDHVYSAYPLSVGAELHKPEPKGNERANVSQAVTNEWSF